MTTEWVFFVVLWFVGLASCVLNQFTLRQWRQTLNYWQETLETNDKLTRLCSELMASNRELLNEKEEGPDEGLFLKSGRGGLHPRSKKKASMGPWSRDHGHRATVAKLREELEAES